MPSVCAQSGKRRVVQMMRAGPDVEEDDRPEMDDRQPVGIDRPLGALRNEIVHDGEEAGGQEEADRVVPVPPLEHGILHATPGDVGFRSEHRDRQRGIVAEMKHGDGDDEGEIEPVGDEDVRLFALDDRHQEHQQIGHPDDRQPQIRVPFRLGIFLGLRHAEQIAGAGDQNEEVIADDDEPGREIARETHAAGLLNDIERGRDQHVAAEREDHRRSMQRPQPAKAGPWQVEIERRPCELRGDQQPDGEAGDAPKHRHHGRELDRAHIVVGPAVDFLRRQRRGTVEIAVHDRKHRPQAGGTR